MVQDNWLLMLANRMHEPDWIKFFTIGRSTNFGTPNLISARLFILFSVYEGKLKDHSQFLFILRNFYDRQIIIRNNCN